MAAGEYRRLDPEPLSSRHAAPRREAATLVLADGRKIFAEVEGEEHEHSGAAKATLTAVIIQIMVLDLVFSLDSVITAVGIADHIEVMIAAVMVAIAVMYFASGPVAHFIERYPTTKMLALSFLLLIGAALVADAFHFHIPRGYIYFAMAFSGAVEAINVMMLRSRRRAAAKAKSERRPKG